MDTVPYLIFLFSLAGGRFANVERRDSGSTILLFGTEQEARDSMAKYTIPGRLGGVFEHGDT